MSLRLNLSFLFASGDLTPECVALFHSNFWAYCYIYYVPLSPFPLPILVYHCLSSLIHYLPCCYLLLLKKNLPLHLYLLHCFPRLNLWHQNTIQIQYVLEHKVWLKLIIMRSGIKQNASKSVLLESMLRILMCKAEYKNVNHTILD